MKRLNGLVAALVLLFAAFASVPVFASGGVEGKESADERGRVRRPLNLAVLVQDDLIARVGNELQITRAFIRALPEGSQVMVGYIRSGSLQVCQPFTTDLEQAAKSLRIPAATTAVSPFNPYVEVIEALRRFDQLGAKETNPNALLLVSDGLDTSRGFDFATAINSIDLHRAVREAKKRDVAIFSFYAPSVGLTSYSRLAVNAGQGALNRLADETGGRAFFQGTSFVTFNAYFNDLRRALNERYAPIS